MYMKLIHKWFNNRSQINTLFSVKLNNNKRKGTRLWFLCTLVKITKSAVLLLYDENIVPKATQTLLFTVKTKQHFNTNTSNKNENKSSSYTNLKNKHDYNDCCFVKTCARRRLILMTRHPSCTGDTTIHFSELVMDKATPNRTWNIAYVKQTFKNDESKLS